MAITTTNKSVLKEVPWGMYVWQLEDGEFVRDQDGNFMYVFTTEGNQKSIDALTQAAKSYGFPEGKAVFWSGKRPLTEEEYQEQLARANFGLVPDPLDVGALRDEARARRAYDKDGR